MKNNKSLRSVLSGVGMAVLLPVTTSATAQDVIRIGGLVTLEGTFSAIGADALRGMKLALSEFNYQVGGKKIELIQAGSDGDPDKAVAKARELIEQHHVDILIGPLSGNEGLAVKDYAKTQAAKTFVNGASAAQDTTLRDPTPNFYRFSPDGAQWIAGLGAYVYEKKKYRKIAIIAEDYSFPHTQIFGFMHEFCGKGGRVVNKFWVPLGEKDFGQAIYSIPKDVDAVLVALGGKSALNFLTQYYGAGMNKPIIGSSVMTDQVVLNSKAKFSKNIIGIPSASPVADTSQSAAWKKFVSAYRKMFPDGYSSPSIFATLYYTETKATLLGLQNVNGDLSNGQKKFQAALAKVSFESPTGRISLDENRNAISDNFVMEIAEAPDGSLHNKVIKVVPQVGQTLGMSREAFLKLGKVGRDNPECK